MASKLIRVNKWNARAVAPNILVGGTPSLEQPNWSAAVPQYSMTTFGTPAPVITVPLAPGVSPDTQPAPSRGGGLFGNVKLGKATDAGSLAGSLINAASPIVGNTLYGSISGGLNSGVGSAVSKFGSMAGSVVGKVNPLLGTAITVGSGIIGGGINALAGTSVDEEKKKENEAGTAYYNNAVSNASSFDEVKGLQDMGSVQNAYKSGVLNKGWSKRRNRAARETRENAIAYAQNGIENNIENIMDERTDNLLAHYAAYGGDLDAPALDYALMSRYLNNRDRQKNIRNKIANILVPDDTPLYAFGGDLQVHGADYPSGLTHVDAGGLHEENPNMGVQYGTDAQGVPNLVEEGEVIYDDYVFSNRIEIDDEAKKTFHIGKKRKMTYADLAKKLESSISELPNDPISKAGFKAQMEDLIAHQERQKQEMEAKKAQEAFDALSPEEQVALMQQAAQQEQMAQEQAVQEQAIAEEAAANGMTPEEYMAAQQEQAMAQQVPEEEMAAVQEQMSPEEAQMIAQQEAPVMAEGGHLYTEGGDVNPWPYDNTKWGEFVIPKGDGTYINLYTPDSENPKNGTYDAGYRAFVENTLDQGWVDNLAAGKYGDLTRYNTSNSGRKFTVDEVKKWALDNQYSDMHKAVGNAYLQYLKDSNSPLLVQSATTTDIPIVAGTSAVETPATEISAAAADITKTTPAPATTTNTTTGTTIGSRPVVPILKNEGLRYAGVFGPALGLGMQLAGIGKPDNSGLDAAVRNFSMRPMPQATAQYLGDYIKYRPMDIWMAQNRNNANTRATDRAILNSGFSPSNAAGLVGNSYAAQIADSQLLQNALAYNDAQKEKVATFNRGTNEFNAKAFNELSQTNAALAAKQRMLAAELEMSAAAQKAKNKADWYNSIYGNIGGLTGALSAIGQDNASRNMVAKLAAAGYYKGLTPENAPDLIKYADAEESKKTKKSKKKGR